MTSNFKPRIHQTYPYVPNLSEIGCKKLTLSCLFERTPKRVLGIRICADFQLPGLEPVVKAIVMKKEIGL